jgi:hypothetical protein
MSATAADVMAELALLDDPKLRTSNEERGDDHGVNLSAACGRQAPQDPA